MTKIRSRCLKQAPFFRIYKISRSQEPTNPMREDIPCHARKGWYVLNSFKGYEMTYDAIIETIKEDKTGLAKGYAISFLQEKFMYLKPKEDLKNLINSDLSLFEEIQKELLESSEPIEGDFVEYEKGKLARISRLHKDENIQLSNKIGVFVSVYGSQASGCTWDPEVEHENIGISDLVLTTKTKKGTCWTFSQNLSGRDRGINFEIDFKIWKKE